MTATMVDELRRALDPAELMRDLGFEPDPWQARALRSTAPRLLMLACRQCGKSRTTATLALHRALYHPNSLVLIVSPTQRQSGETYRKILTSYRDLDRPVPATEETSTTLGLSNGSRVVSLPGEEKNIRGFSGVSLAIVDEASRVDDAIFAAVSPMVAVSGGRLIYLSTPFGARGEFFRAWAEQGHEWERYRATALDCPRITREFLESERRRLGDRWWSQEYMCEFVEATGQVFSTDSITAAFDCDEPPLFGRGPAPVPEPDAAGYGDDDLEPLFPPGAWR